MRSPGLNRVRRGTILPRDQRPDPNIAERVSYVGSPEHKKSPSFAGSPRPRADATICDPSFADRQDELTEWLREAIRKGAVGAPIEGDFPRYVWFRNQSDVYIGRLINRGLGQYKGWQLEDPDEWPEGLGELYD